MKRSIITLYCFSILMFIGDAWLKGGTAEKPESGDVMIELGPNDTGEIFTVSDIYTYSGQNCTGTKTTLLAKGDPSDDVHIAPFGGTKSFYLGKCQSYTLSYLWQGKEVETDDTWDTDLSDQSGGVFESDYAGLIAIDFSAAGVGPLPLLGVAHLINGGTGHIEGGGYDWITFYDATASDGMIERDPQGNPVSPVLPDGTSVLLAIGYNTKIFKLVGYNASADLNGSGIVDLGDLAIMAGQWLTEGIPEFDGMVWIQINDPGVDEDDDGTPDHESFNGEMSKYETTNAQYCQYLNAAKDSGDVVVDGSDVKGASGPYSGQTYYNLAGSGINYNAAVSGGAARINWTGGSFTVDSGFENHPVTYVSWYGAMAFATYCGWRLPTEWEWQAVADYDGSYSYGCGTDINTSIANYFNSIHPDGTTDAGVFGAYGYGMCDMAGNVAEWTDSCRYVGCDPDDRVLRDGGWGTFGGFCSVSYRSFGSPSGLGDTNSNIGFRVCR